jgi:hypothetical protein
MAMKEPRPDPRWTRNTALARYLGVSTMCLWRWQRQDDLNFPKATRINGIDYTDLNLIDSWMRARAVDRTTKRGSARA